MDQLQKFLVNLELEKPKSVTLYASLVKCQKKKVEQKVKQCTLILKEHLDLKDLFKLLKDLVLMDKKYWKMLLLPGAIPLICR